jgi:hypothetical protein
MSLAAPRLEFHGPVRTAGGWVRVLAWCLLGTALLGAAAFAEHAAQLSDERDALQSRQEVLQARLRPLSARSAAAPKPDADELRRIAQANAAIDKLSVPWNELLSAFEAIRLPHIGLLSLVPNAEERSMRMSGEARSVPDLMAYVERVTALPALTQVHLVGFETVPRDGARVVSFTLFAKWQAR